jgi:hypothetical protein
VGGKARKNGEEEITLDLETAERLSDLVSSAARLIDMVEGPGGFSTARNAGGVRLKDTDEWTTLYLVSRRTR